MTRAGRQLFRDAQATLGPEPRLMVIDPLIDANTGAQTVSTAKMGDDLEALAKKDFRSYAVTPLTRNTLATKPLLLIGTLTPVNVERSIDKQPDAFRVWLTLIDLRSGKVVAKALDRATVDSVNPEPLPFYRDSPTWHKDATIMGYINSCQVNTKIGDPADPEYLARLPAAAVINEAILAYDDGKMPVANRLYKEAQPIADPGDLRVLNGLYITNWQLGKKDEARDAFGKLVSSGLELKRLPMKLLFQPGRSTFITSGDLPAQYSIWLASLAEQAGRTPACVRIVGHTSRTGSAGHQRAAVAAARRGGAEDAREGQPRPVVEAERGGGGLEGGAGRPRAPTTCATRSTGGWSSGSSTAYERGRQRSEQRNQSASKGRRRRHGGEDCT